jgi:hypothetical protein
MIRQQMIARENHSKIYGRTIVPSIASSDTDLYITKVDRGKENDECENSDLNTSLYLHDNVSKEIESLEDYIALETLRLDSNRIERIENFGHMLHLKFLDPRGNSFTEIRNLDSLQSIMQLDLSNNALTCVEGCFSELPNLSILNLAKNKLTNAESVSQLSLCKALSTLDLSHNELRGEDVINKLGEIPELDTLHMNGNPIVSEIAMFRKTCIVTIKNLKYLDRTIFDSERAIAEVYEIKTDTTDTKLTMHIRTPKIKCDPLVVRHYRKFIDDIRVKSDRRHERILKNGFLPGGLTDVDPKEKQSIETYPLKPSNGNKLCGIESKGRNPGRKKNNSLDQSKIKQESKKASSVTTACEVAVRSKIGLMNDKENADPVTQTCDDIDSDIETDQEEDEVWTEDKYITGLKNTDRAQDILTNVMWTKDMDGILSQNVYDCAYDYGEVTKQMNREFPHIVAMNPELCRKRWNQISPKESIDFSDLHQETSTCGEASFLNSSDDFSWMDNFLSDDTNGASNNICNDIDQSW